MDELDPYDYSATQDASTYPTDAPVDTSNTPATGAPSTPSGGWTPQQEISVFNSVLGAALTADAIHHGKNLPTSYGYGSNMVPGAVAKRNHDLFVLLLIVGVIFLVKEK
ncbi:hypothetical protein ACO0K0_01540 [Undibacterium sp. SXout11W]|uniref:hypothetical protein n=1 Tax=Undibacterium sp. SXout11W TaxID=3413050 RepID=UPI003BF396BC